MLNKFDELFDSLNADSADLRGGKKHSTNMTRHSPHLNLFKYMKEFIRTLKFKGLRSPPPPSQVGWIHTMNAVERLWRNLNALDINSIATRRLNQDPLENCFGCIRYHCGSNDNPNVIQFISGIKTAIISNLRNTGHRTNCEADTAVLNDNLSTFLLSSSDQSDKQPDKCTESIPLEINLDQVLADATEAVDQATPEAQACAYVCGFIFKKLKSNKCANCLKAFLSDFTFEPIHMFTSFREYDNLSSSLNYVNKNFVCCVETCTTLLNTFLVQKSWTENIKEKAIHLFSQVDFGFITCEQHRVLTINHVKISVFYIVMKRYVTLKNRQFAEDERAKSLQKKMRILKNK